MNEIITKTKTLPFEIMFRDNKYYVRNYILEKTFSSHYTKNQMLCCDKEYVEALKIIDRKLKLQKLLEK